MKKFAELTPKNQKMQIVKDAIAQIKTKQIKASRGTYVELLNFNTHTQAPTSLQSLLSDGQKCECCAKGALFLSCVSSVNRVKTGEDFRDDDIKRRLKKWFTVLELDMIEAAFERSVVNDDTGKLETYSGFWYEMYTPTNLGRACIAFGKRYESDKNRLIAILENILQNGEFKPWCPKN